MRCLLCYVDDGMHSASPKINHESVDSQLPVIFLLKKLLNVRDDICETLTKRNGNPSTWGVAACSLCEEMVHQAKTIYEQIYELKKNLTSIRTLCENKVLRSIEPTKVVARNGRSRPASAIPVDYIRQEVVKELHALGRECPETDEIMVTANPLEQSNSMESQESNSYLKGFNDISNDSACSRESENEDEDPNFELKQEFEIKHDSSSDIDEFDVEEADDRLVFDVADLKEIQMPNEISNDAEDSRTHADVVTKNILFGKHSTNKRKLKQDSELDSSGCRIVNGQGFLLKQTKYSADAEPFPNKIIQVDEAMFKDKSESTIEKTDEELKPTITVKVGDTTFFVCNKCHMSFREMKELHCHHSQTHEEPMTESPCQSDDDDNEVDEGHPGHLEDSNADSSQKISTFVVPQEEEPEEVNKCEGIKSASPDKEDPLFLRCIPCDRNFKTKNAYSTHNKMIHSGVRTCNQCEKSFNNTAHLMNHMKIHSSTKLKYKCDICMKMFAEHKKLILHEEQFHGDRPNSESEYISNDVCTICHKSFASSKSLKNHMANVHSDCFDKNPYKCSVPECELSFPSLNMLNHHLQIFHNDDSLIQNPGPAICEFCGKTFSSLAACHSHIKLIHCGVQTCTDCGESFENMPLLMVHRKHKHNKEKNFMCEECPKGFSGARQLDIHQAQSHGRSLNSKLASKYTCQTCQKILSTLKALRRHMSTVHRPDDGTEKPFKCTYSGCHYSCVDKYSLRNHIKHLHEGVPRRKSSVLKPCPECEKVFNKNEVLNRHLKCVHKYDIEIPDYSQQCQLCGEILRGKKWLLIHQNKKHGESHDLSMYSMFKKTTEKHKIN